MTKDFSGIYCIENVDTKEKYIGRSKGIFARWHRHVALLNNGKHYNRAMQRAWRTNKFIFYILEICNESFLEDEEKHWISKFDTFNGTGYNATPGGDDAEYHRINGYKRGVFHSSISYDDRKAAASKAVSYLLQGQPLTFITSNTGLSLNAVKMIRSGRAWAELSAGLSFPKTSPELAKQYREQYQKEHRFRAV